jgi:hypothetical protein
MWMLPSPRTGSAPRIRSRNAATENAGETLNALLENSDAALYCAKAEGRYRVKRGELPRPEGGASTSDPGGVTLRRRDTRCSLVRRIKG